MTAILKSYNALTGEELKRTILREVERALDNAGINSPAITFPLASWSWHLDIFQREGDGETKREIGEEPERHITAGTPIPADAPERTVKALTGGSKRFKHHPPAPTEVREAEGLKMPEEG